MFDLNGNLFHANPALLNLVGVSSVEDLKGFNIFKDPNMPEDAIQLGKAWGFKKFLSMNGLVWHKLTKNGLTHFGMGHGTRASTESVMIMYNGSLGRLIKDKSIRNIFEAKMLTS